MNAIELIKAERERQVSAEGWIAEHDDFHFNGELSDAADCYFRFARNQINNNVSPGTAADPGKPWPWTLEWWKPSPDPIRNAVKAGALYLAEKDRISRNQAEIGYTVAQFQYGNTHTKYLGCISLINRLTPEVPAPVSVEITQAHVERAAAAIANARAGRRGAPPIKNVLDILPPKLKAEVIEDAEAALVAAFTRLPSNSELSDRQVRSNGSSTEKKP